ALALALGRRPDAADETLGALDDLDIAEPVFKPVELTQARAWVAASAGALGAAHRLLEEAADQGQRIGDRLGEAGALHGLARLGRATDVTARLGLVAAELGGGLAPAPAAHARALASGHSDAPHLVP